MRLTLRWTLLKTQIWKPIPARNLILETGVACCCCCCYLFIYFFWKARYLKHGPWQFSFFDLLSQTVKYATLFLVNTFDNSLWISKTTALVNATVSCLSCLLLLSISFTIPPLQHDGRTPIMEIVRSNAMDMVKVLIYATDDRKIWETKETTLVDLTLQDNEGKSVIHHCVQNREVGLCL